jgi:deazaflavin-dependent oxidoreductase (nitroreductase family)
MRPMHAKDVLARSLTGVHETVFRASDGRLLGRLAGMPVVMLTTTGRKSGKPRTTMLTSPVQEGHQVVLVASYGGDDRHPAWFLNLRDDPDVEVTMLGRRRTMRARIASAHEKAALWPRVTAAYRGYEGYQRRTGRDIPVVILEPTGPDTEEGLVATEERVGPATDLPPGKVTGAGRWAVGNVGGEYFAVTRRCRHLYADLAGGRIDQRDGCLVCPWHGSKYDVKTGRMVRGPQGAFARVPGLSESFKLLTKVVPLGRGKVVERDGELFVRPRG